VSQPSISVSYERCHARDIQQRNPPLSRPRFLQYVAAATVSMAATVSTAATVSMAGSTRPDSRHRPADSQAITPPSQTTVLVPITAASYARWLAAERAAVNTPAAAIDASCLGRPFMPPSMSSQHHAPVAYGDSESKFCWPSSHRPS